MQRRMLDADFSSLPGRPAGRWHSLHASAHTSAAPSLPYARPSATVAAPASLHPLTHSSSPPVPWWLMPYLPLVFRIPPHSAPACKAHAQSSSSPTSRSVLSSWRPRAPTLAATCVACMDAAEQGAKLPLASSLHATAGSNDASGTTRGGNPGGCQLLHKLQSISAPVHTVTNYSVSLPTSFH